MPKHICIACSAEIQQLYEGLMCEECNRWQHLNCGTGISQHFYWKVAKCLGVFEWSCSACSTSTQISPQPKRRCSGLDGDGRFTTPSCPVLPNPVLPDPVLPDPVLPEPVLPDPILPESVLPGSVLPGLVLPEPILPEPVLPEPVLPEPVLQDPVLLESTGPSTSGHQPKPSFHPEPVHLVPSSPEADLDSESDCESFLEFFSPAENQLPAEPEPVTYSILETGSVTGKRLLMSSDGHGFRIRSYGVSTARWDCNVLSCKAYVSQRGDTFTLQQRAHYHSPDPKLKLKLDMITEAKVRAVDDIDQSAESIADEICSRVPKEAVNPAKTSDLVIIVKNTRRCLGTEIL